MKRLVLLGAGLVIVGMGLWMGFYPTDWQNWLGFSHNAYFIYGTNYAFTSGPGPMMLTAAGMSTIISGLWHAKNCHADGCWRIGRHHVNGTPWCNTHEGDARNLVTTEALLMQLLEAQKGTNRLLTELLDSR